jgi:hypothetical protein
LARISIIESGKPKTLTGETVKLLVDVGRSTMCPAAPAEYAAPLIESISPFVRTVLDEMFASISSSADAFLLANAQSSPATDCPADLSRLR